MPHLPFAAPLDVPFLPAGRGGLILILGGLLMLATALFMLLVAPGRIPAGSHAPSGGVGRTLGRLAAGIEAPPPRHEIWHAGLLRSAHQIGLGISIQYADGPICVAVVDHCRSCRRGRPQCLRERRKMRRAARSLGHVSRVEEVACRLGGAPRCAFLVDLRR